MKVARVFSCRQTRREYSLRLVLRRDCSPTSSRPRSSQSCMRVLPGYSRAPRLAMPLSSVMARLTGSSTAATCMLYCWTPFAPILTFHFGSTPAVEDFAAYKGGVTVAALSSNQLVEERALAFVGADGLWSRVRERLGHATRPRFARRTAWRALAPAAEATPGPASAAVNLWLGRHAHLVHYAVRGGSLVNVVAVIRDEWRERGWSASGERREILARFPPGMWAGAVRQLLEIPEQWRKWALFDCKPLRFWGKGPVTLLGDAAHPMLPYLAQGAAMAIEDAAILANELARTPDEPGSAMRRYKAARQRRTARVQGTARRNGIIYHMGGAEAFLRGVAMAAMGGERIISRYDWLYRWKPAG